MPPPAPTAEAQRARLLTATIFTTLMGAPLTIARGLWGLWLLSWLAAAGWSAKTVARQSLPARLAHITLLCAGALLLFKRPYPMSWLQGPLLAIPPGATWVAVGVLLAGFAFAWWARLHLGRNWSGTVTLKADHALVRSGPYGITRNPIYTGLLLSLVATVLLRNDVAAVIGFALILTGLLIKIRQEERLLAGHFGPAYAAYRADVPALVPRLW